MVVGTIQMKVRSEKRREFLQTMDDLMEELRELHGCSSYRFYMSNGDPSEFQLISEWADFDVFQSHLTSHAFRVFRGSRPLLSDEPYAHVDLVSRRAQVDTVNDWNCA
jgi:quinol monooxygenase YgiN